MGARLNWILHFGLPPRFNPDVRVIQLDIAAEEIGTNVPTEVALVGDAKAIVDSSTRPSMSIPGSSPPRTPGAPAPEKDRRQPTTTEPMMHDDSVPMGYYRVLREVRDLLPRDAVIVNEGASTMDIGRTVLPELRAAPPPRRRDLRHHGHRPPLRDSRAAVHRDKRVVAVLGDSAFGFRDGGRGGMPLQHADHVRHCE